MRGLARPDFVGRQAELGQLQDALAAAAASQPKAVAVTGDAGVGKTRLLAEFAQSARTGGALVVAGAGIDLAAGEFPFGVLLSAFRDLARSTRAANDNPTQASSLAEVIDLLRTDATPGDAERGARTQLFERVLDLLGELSDQQPLVVILEDLHWADRSSLDLLRFLVQDLCQERDLLRDLPRERVMFVLSWRTDEVVDGSPTMDALTDIERLEGVQGIHVQPLGRDELGAIIESVATSAMPRQRAEEIVRRSAGNPLFAQELLAAGDAADNVSHVSIRQVVLRRSRTLSGDARQALRALAVIGRATDDELLGEVAELSPAALGAALREALDQRILRRAGDGELITFRHPLGQEALYDDVLPSERVVLHRRVAESLEHREHDDVHGNEAPYGSAELTHHWHEARVWAKALPGAIAAARQAVAVTGFTEAYGQLTRALAAWGHVPDAETVTGTTLAALQQEAAEAAHWAGATTEAVTLVTTARETAKAGGDKHAEALLSERLGRYLWELGDATASLAADRETVALLADEAPSRLRARAHAALAAGLLLDGESTDAAEHAAKAIELARAAGLLEEEGYALTTLGVARTVQGALDEGLQMLDRARTICEDCGSLEEIFRVYVNQTFVLTTAGRTQESLDVAYAGMARVRQLGLTSTGGGALLVNTASTMQLLGQWDEAVRVAVDALQQGVPQAFAGYLHLALADVATARGDAEAAETHLTDAERIAPLRGDAWFGATLAAGRAELSLWRGDPAAALVTIGGTLPGLDKPDYDELAARLCAIGRRAVADQAERHRLLPDTPPADPHLVKQLTVREQQSRDGAARAATPAIDAYLLLADAEAGRERGHHEPDAWSAVADAWKALKQPYPRGYALWREAESLVATKQRRKAGAAVAEASVLAESLGAAPLQRELTALTNRASLAVESARPAEPVPASTAQRLGLTPREQQVLPLVASGRTNRQIARALFISEKTVSVHVSNIMMKLGASNRGEAAAAAFTLDLVPTTPS